MKCWPDWNLSLVIFFATPGHHKYNSENTKLVVAKITDGPQASQWKYTNKNMKTDKKETKTVVTFLSEAVLATCYFVCSKIPPLFCVYTQFSEEEKFPCEIRQISSISLALQIAFIALDYFKNKQKP